MSIPPVSREVRVDSCAVVMARALLVGLIFLSTPASALRVDRVVRWTPSTSPNVSDYELSIGTRTGVYSSFVDLGLPTAVAGTMAAGVQLDDASDVYIALRARAANGLYSDYSNEILVPAALAPSTPGTPDPGGPGTGGDPGGGSPGASGGSLFIDPIDSRPPVGFVDEPSGTVSWVTLDARTTPVYPDARAALGQVRAVWCDLDGDLAADLVLGFPQGGQGKVVVVPRGAGFFRDPIEIDAGDHLVSIPNPGGTGVSLVDYATANGATQPACGDIDGDGRKEIVVGLGPGGRIRVRIFDDWTTGFAEMPQTASGAGEISLGGIGDASRAVMPTVGDLDGDGIDEIAIGSGVGQTGLLSVFDDALSGFAPLRSDLSANAPPAIRIAPRIAYDGSVRPAAGDIDGDGLAEIVVGLGSGGEGRAFLVEDLASGLAVTPFWAGGHRGYYGGPGYAEANGETIPSVADLDGDGRVEIAIGLGRGSYITMYVFDDFQTGFAYLPTPYPPDGMLGIGSRRTAIPALRPLR